MKSSPSNTICKPSTCLNSGVKLFCLLAFLLGGNWGWGQTYADFDITNGASGSTAGTDNSTIKQYTWNVPAGVSSIRVEVWGSGGGGSRSSSDGDNGGGGSGGVYARKYSYSVSAGTTLYIQVGKGGAGGTSSSINGGSGNPSWVRITSQGGAVIASANGGNGAVQNSTSATGGAQATTYSISATAPTTNDDYWYGGAGGGGNGSNGRGGGGGGGAGSGGQGSSGTANTSNPAPGGNGGAGLTTLFTGLSGGTGGTCNGSSNAGGPGALRGGGGAGGGSFSGARDGGAGGGGFVRITYTVTPAPTISSFTPSTVCASSGATVTITGTNFTGATAVSFGGTAATSFTVNSATQITATVGAGTTGTISVTTPGGTVTSSGTLTVNALASSGTFQYANGSTQTICAGSTISCTNSISPTAGSGALSVVWYCGELNGGGTVGGNYGTQYGNWRESTLSNVSGTTSSVNLNAAAGGGAGMSLSLTNYNPQLDFPGKTNFVIIRRAYNSNCGVCGGGCQDQYFYLNLTTVTAAPTIITPLCSGATTITGTSANNASVIVTVNGVAQAAVSADASGNWSTSVPALTAGHIVTATAQVTGQCVSNASSQVTVSATPTTATVTSSTLSVCGSLTSGSLGGNTPVTGTGAWSIVSGGTGSFSAINSGSSTFTANAYGTYVLRWTISNSPCTASTADVTVTFSTQTILWANTQSPDLGVSCSNDNFNVYGQVYIPGVTEGAGQGANVTAQLGYHTSNTDPSTWPSGNWVNATHNPAVTGNNDEYMGTLTGLAGNTYYYAFRYSYNGCAYVYGGYSAPNASSNIWTVNTNSGSAFVGNSTTNGGGSSGGINSSNGVAFGLYNNSGTTTEAIRNFPSLLVGQTVRLTWIMVG